MRQSILALTATLALLSGCNQSAPLAADPEPVRAELTKRMAAASNIVDAVNAKDAQLYGRDLAPRVRVVMYNGEMVLEGRESLIQNRASHFANYPDARNELIHLVEIDDRVIMNDRVWLSSDQTKPAEIVEIFTFEGDKIVRIDVIQPKDLLASR